MMVDDVRVLLIIVIFSVFCVFEFVFDVIVSGSILYINVIDVIKIGCKWRWIVVIVVLISFIFLFILWIVNFIIKMVFFDVRLIVVNRFICR